MSDERALLAAIREAPNDDLPRLAHADWLEEHGEQARAEFVRVQIARARLPWDDDRQSELLARERVLLIEHGPDWLPPGVPMQVVRFRRGYVEGIECDLDTLKAHSSCLAGWPVRSLTLHALSDPAWLRDCRLLDGVEALTIRDYGDAAWTVLASPRLKNLRRLSIEGAGWEGLRDAWDRTGLTTRLESLELHDLGADWRGMTELLERPWPRLRRLLFHENGLDTQAAVALMTSDLWPRLDGISLGDVGIGESQRAALVTALERMNATSLALPSPHGGFDLFGAVASAATWGRLRSLSIDDRHCDPRSLGRLLRHPGLVTLTHLGIQAGQEVWRTYNGPAPAKLRSLTCPNQDAFGLLTRAVNRPPLVEANARGPEDHLVAFLNSPGASRLRRLSLGGEMNERVAAALASSPYLGRLATLTSWPGPVNVAAARILAGATNLPCLTFTRLMRAEPGVERVLLESPLPGWVSVGEVPRADDLAVLRQARYRGVNWGYVLDEL